LAARKKLAGLISDDRPDEAQRLREQLIAAWACLAAERSRRLGPVHPDTVDARAEHADLHHWFGGLNASDEATRMHEEITNDHLRILGPDHPRTLHAQVRLARHYGWFDPRLPALAEPLLDRLYSAPEPNHDDIRSVRHWLISARAKVGDITAAQPSTPNTRFLTTSKTTCNWVILTIQPRMMTSDPTRPASIRQSASARASDRLRSAYAE
jgi:hypothetical protein